MHCLPIGRDPKWQPASLLFITLSCREGIYTHVFSNLLDQWFSNSGVGPNRLIRSYLGHTPSLQNRTPIRQGRCWGLGSSTLNKPSWPTANDSDMCSLSLENSATEYSISKIFPHRTLRDTSKHLVSNLGDNP